MKLTLVIIIRTIKHLRSAFSILSLPYLPDSILNTCDETLNLVSETLTLLDKILQI